ncbi:MAG: metal-dependent hydrolase [Fluviicoccus sp.]|uniref:metal-dependent hydrolase n=1 Tax=Fluviicoccus sp. TaxID=2003552 RepID=UPI00271FE5C7|nr:metal-dependent hydrolase [Fluviicoccus sp.]MDO8330606.1 metal-dependent hydrolase [Fluviicoccus sp.]
MTAAAKIKNIPEHRHNLKVRRMDFEFSDDIPEFWYGNDPFRTLLMAAMSAGFPEGERFFIDSVRQFRDRITDPELQQAVSAFIGQEAHHSKEHDVLNTLMKKRGYNIGRIERGVRGAMKMFRTKFSPERQLAHTAAVEHFTALMSEQYLLNEEILSEFDPRMVTLWAWHAIEETEHKAVAFDVYKTIGGDEWTRLSAMAMASVLFVGFTSYDFYTLVRESGHAGDAKMWLKGLDYYWGRKGVFRKMIPAYLQYYRRDFHPWQHDSRAQVERIKQKYLGDKA